MKFKRFLDAMRWLIRVPWYEPFVHLRRFDRQLHYIYIYRLSNGWQMVSSILNIFAEYSLFLKNRFCIVLCDIKSFSSFFCVFVKSVREHVCRELIFWKNIYFGKWKRCSASKNCMLHLFDLYNSFYKNDKNSQIYNYSIVDVVITVEN